MIFILQNYFIPKNNKLLWKQVVWNLKISWESSISLDSWLSLTKGQNKLKWPQVGPTMIKPMDQNKLNEYAWAGISTWNPQIKPMDQNKHMDTLKLNWKWDKLWRLIQVGPRVFKVKWLVKLSSQPGGVERNKVWGLRTTEVIRKPPPSGGGGGVSAETEQQLALQAT